MGPFPGYHDSRCSGVTKPVAKDNVASMFGVIELHRAAVEEIQTFENSLILKDEARNCWNRAAGSGKKQVTVMRRSRCSRPPARLVS